MLVPVLIVIIAFILLRELWTWYWKINLIVKNQASVSVLLEQILDEIRHQSPSRPITSTPAKGKVKIKNKETDETKFITIDEWKTIDQADGENTWEIVD